MQRVGLTGLVKIELPSRTLRFSDGYFRYDGQVWDSDDDVFGTIGGFETMEEGVGDMVPEISMKLLPPDTTAPVEISQPGNQTARVTFYIVEFDADTHVPITGDVFFTGQIDQTELIDGEDVYELNVSVVSLAERLFDGNSGNFLSDRWHRSVWTAEKGHANGTGLSKSVAWGVESPRAYSYGGGGGGGWGGGSGSGNGFGQFPYVRVDKY